MTEYDIPSDLIINWDHAGLNIVPVSNWTMASEGSKRVEIAGLGDKRQITAVFSGTLSLFHFRQIYLTMSKLKPFSAKWLVQMYKHISYSPDVIRHGFKETGIVNTLKAHLEDKIPLARAFTK